MICGNHTPSPCGFCSFRVWLGPSTLLAAAVLEQPCCGAARCSGCWQVCGLTRIILPISLSMRLSVTPVQPQCSPSAVLVQFQCSPSTIAPALGGIDGHTGTTCLGSKRSHQGDDLSENITAVL